MCENKSEKAIFIFPSDGIAFIVSKEMTAAVKEPATGCNNVKFVELNKPGTMFTPGMSSSASIVKPVASVVAIAHLSVVPEKAGLTNCENIMDILVFVGVTVPPERMIVTAFRCTETNDAPSNPVTLSRFPSRSVTAADTCENDAGKRMRTPPSAGIELVVTNETLQIDARPAT
jgi:hypothetical protein